MAERGGEQRIPRPARHRPGGPAPWAHLTPEGRRFDAAHLRARCAALPPARRSPEAAGRPAAVLLALFEEDRELHLVLTKRPETMPSHRGEIAFPGGKVAAEDASLADAALREAEEEVGLPPAAVELLAELDTIGTVASQFAITPFVGLLAARPVLAPHPTEVVAAFTVPVAELLDPEAWHEERWELWGRDRSMAFFLLPGETVWGATARILTTFLADLTGTVAPT